MMDRILLAIERAVLPVLGFLLAFITIAVFIQVVLRYGFAKSFLWGEELSLFAFIWCVFLGAAVCQRRRTHFAFDFLEGRLGARGTAAQRLVVDLLVLVCAVLLLVEGWTFSQLSLQRFSPALGITLFVPTIVIPLSGAFMTIALAASLLRHVRQIWTGEAA